jgi:TonB family protein
VTFEIIVDSNGDVENPIVVNTPGYGLEQKALGAVRKWKLKPARGSDGNPIPAAVILEVVFRCT